MSGRSRGEDAERGARDTAGVTTGPATPSGVERTAADATTVEPTGASAGPSRRTSSTRPERASTAGAPGGQSTAVTRPGPAADGGGSTGVDRAVGAEPPPGPGGRRTDLLVVVGVGAALALPLVIAAVALRTPRWYPQVDLAQIEMRVRDVFSAHPPTVGLGGRIVGLGGTQGAHPGPLGFYVLAPLYRLLGGSSWALQAADVVLNVVAMVTTLWATHRRWGRTGTLGMGVALAALMAHYGLHVLTYPWNPFLPVLVWVLFLVTVWGVVCGDLALLPVAVVAGSLCAQTHLPYVGLVGGLVLVVLISLVVGHRRARDGAARRRIRWWGAGSAVLGAVLWSPVAIQQVGGDPGNVTIIVESFRHPREPAIGYGEGWSILVRHLDLARVLGVGSGDGRAWVGAALVVVWVVAAVVAVRRRARDLAALHLVVAMALVLGVVNAANILGIPWYYLSLWAYGTATLAAVAVVATAARVVAPSVERRLGPRRSTLSWVPAASLGVALVAVLVPTVTDAPHTTVETEQRISDAFAAVFPDTVAAVEDGRVPGGPEGTLLVTWSDPVSLGGPGLSMVLELERAGYDVGALDVARLQVRDHRVVDPAEADAEIHVAFGVGAVDRARTHPGAREIAFVDPRTEAQRQDYTTLRARLIEGLRGAGLDELVPEVDQNLFAVSAHPELPPDLAAPVYIMGTMPQPLSVLVWEPGT